MRKIYYFQNNIILYLNAVKNIFSFMLNIYFRRCKIILDLHTSFKNKTDTKHFLLTQSVSTMAIT